MKPRISQLGQSGATTGQAVVWNGTEWAPAGGGSAHVVQDEGAALTQRAALNFVGAGVTATDNAANGRTIVTIPGGSGGGSSYPLGNADALPAVPNAKDDEFDGTSTATWTATPTMAATNVVHTERPGHLKLRAAGTASTFVGRHQVAPATFPYTLITKVAGHTARLDFHRGGGILLYPATPTAASPLVYLGVLQDSPNLGGIGVARITNTSQGAFGSAVRAAFKVAEASTYFRVVMTSATAASLSFSSDGWAWRLLETLTVPFSVGAVGLGVTEEGGGGTDSFFDFFRVT